MKSRNIQLSKILVLLIMLPFMSTNIEAQSGDFEFLFSEDGNTEGWVVFGDGTIAVQSEVLTYTYGSNTAGFQLNPPSSDIYIDKTDYPYLAIQLSSQPSERTYMYCKVSGAGGWYENKSNAVTDEDLNALNVFYYDLNGNFPTDTLADGLIDRLIFNLSDTVNATVDVDWIKTFASVQDIKDYVTLSTGLDDIVNESETKIFSGEGEIKVQNCELNSKIEIYDISGRFMNSSIALTNEITINCDRGIYIVKVSNETTTQIEKVIVY
jgi:hypothetical protein